MSEYLIGNAHLITRILPHTGNSFVDRRHFSDDKATGALGFCPKNGLWSGGNAVPLRFYLDQRAAGLTVKTAGRLATKVWEGMQMHPDATQLVIVTLENGSTSVHPAEAVDLRSGYIGGVHLASALVVDVRNLRARIDRAVAADGQIIGERDDA